MSSVFASWAGATVILKDGQRTGWKIQRGIVPYPGGFSHRHFGGFKEADCTHESRRFEEPDAFVKAAEWARGFPRHEKASGSEP